MAESTIWWMLAGATVAVELATGTFYLLMLSIGIAAAAVAAHLGASLAMQMVVAALVGGGAVAAWHWLKLKGPQEAPAAVNRDVHIDIGETLRVEQWGGDGTASVKYRGANWTAVWGGGAIEDLAPGVFRITGLSGNRLVVNRLVP